MLEIIIAIKDTIVGWFNGIFMQIWPNVSTKTKIAFLIPIVGAIGTIIYKIANLALTIGDTKIPNLNKKKK